MKKFLSLSAAFLAPGLAFAQATTAHNTGLYSLVVSIQNLLKLLFPIMVAIGVLAFFYELIRFITAKSEDKKKEFQNGLIFSLLALFLMFTFFGILKVIANTLGVGDAVGAGVTTNDIPTVQL